MNNEQITYHLKPLVTAVKSFYSVFAVEIPGIEEQEDIKLRVKSIVNLVDMIGNASIEHEIDFDTQELRAYTTSPNEKECEYFSFEPHISTGYSPVVSYGEKSNVRGVFVRLKHVSHVYCGKTMDKLAKALYEKKMKEGDPIYMKEAKKAIREQTREQNNPENVPLLKKENSVYIYLDSENQCFLAKNGKRSQDAIRLMLHLLATLPEKLDSKYETNLTEIKDIAFESNIYSQAYTNHSMSRGVAFGAYNISNLVDFYANEKSDEACPVEPTMTAEMKNKEDSTQIIAFKNSVDLFMESEPGDSVFSSLKFFSEEKNLDFKSIRVTSEMHYSDQIKEYIAEFPEVAGEDLGGDLLTISFDTKSIDGNIGFKIADAIKYHIEATRKLSIHAFTDRHYSFKEMEPVMLEQFAGLLSVLHDSSNLFIELYIRANQATEEFGSAITDAIEQATKQEPDKDMMEENKENEEAA